MMLDVLGREDDEAAGWLPVEIVGSGAADVLAMVRRGARAGRVGREELGIGSKVEGTALNEF